MESYPKLIVGEELTERQMRKVKESLGSLYECRTIDDVRAAVSELYHSRVLSEEVTIWLPEPRKHQFIPLLKLMEDSQLKLVICVPGNCVPDVVWSRAASFENDDEIRFVNPINKLRMSNRIRRKVYDLFDM